jgi:hypothetical protein
MVRYRVLVEDMLGVGVVIGEAMIGVSGANERGMAIERAALRGMLSDVAECDESPWNLTRRALSTERASSAE